MPDFVFYVLLRPVDGLEVNQVRLCNVPVAFSQLQVVCKGDEGELRVITEPEGDVLFKEGSIAAEKPFHTRLAYGMRGMGICKIPEPEAQFNRCIPLGGME